MKTNAALNADLEVRVAVRFWTAAVAAAEDPMQSDREEKAQSAVLK